MSVLRQRLAVSAVLVTALTVTVATGCASNAKPHAGSTQTSSTQPGGTATAPSTPSAFKVGALLVSDGTSAVTVGGVKFTFPTTVTDAAWSADGSRIAFIDADGNVDSAHPDGTGRLVLTTSPKSGVTRSGPAWGGDRILYTERSAGGATIVKGVYANGYVDSYMAGAPADASAIGGANAPATGNSAPSAADAHLSDGTVGETAFQHKGSAGPEVWIIDKYQRDANSVKLADGSQPAVSPDGTQVAYVGKDGQIHLVPSSTPGGKTPQTTAVSSGLAAPTHLTWTPDGARVVFSTAADIESIAAHPAGGAQAGKPAVVSKSTGVATYLGASTDRAERLAAADPIAGAIAVNQARWQTAKTYAISQSSLYAYGAALANPADPVAAALGSGGMPLLYTGAAALDPRTKAELQRMFGALDKSTGEIPTITIVGDSGMVSTATEKAVQALGYKTKRVSGADAYAVNVAVLKSGMSSNVADSVIVVSGDDPAAIAAESLAGFNPVLLTHGQTLPADAAQYLSGLASGSTVYVVGTQAGTALGAWSKMGVKVVPIIGADPAEISVLLAKNLLGSPAGVVLVNPGVAADQAVAITAAQQLGYAVLLIDPSKGLEAVTKGFLDDSSAGIGTTLAIGPAASIPAVLAGSAANAAASPLGSTSADLTYTAR